MKSLAHRLTPLLVVMAAGLSLPLSTFAAADVPGLSFRAVVKRDHIGFGEPQTIRLTLTNKGQAMVTIHAGDLVLIQKAWEVPGIFGTTRGLTLPLLLPDAGKAPVEIPPGGSIILSGVENEIVTFAMGMMTASYELSSQEAPIRSLLLRNASFKVTFEVGPSEAITSVQTAKTAAEHQHAQALVHELLKMRARWDNDDYLRCGAFAQKSFEKMGGHALPYLASAASDSDALVRRQAVEAYSAVASRAADTSIVETAARLAVGALRDVDPGVRCAGLGVLTYRWPTVPKTVLDSAGVTNAADVIVAALKDPSEDVRAAALAAMQDSPQPLPLDRVTTAFKSAKGGTALVLQALIVAQAKDSFSTTLLDGFTARSQPERLAILSDIGGLTDSAAFRLVGLGLQDTNAAVQHTALMRLLAFSPKLAVPALQTHAPTLLRETRPVSEMVRNEIESRRMFPFLRPATNHAAAPQTLFPSLNGSVPMLSPDGQRLAYVEGGYGRPGGSGGFGGSNYRSIVHVVALDGTGDQIVSDLFLLGWLADSRRIASYRDWHAAITDLKGDLVAEFGKAIPGREKQGATPFGGLFLRGPPPDHWTKGELRQQDGHRMPLHKTLYADGGNNPDAVVSPDGKWFGPMLARDAARFISPEGAHLEIRWPTKMLAEGEQRFSNDFQNNMSGWGQRAAWSPDGHHVAVIAFWGKPWFIIDVEKQTAWLLPEADPFPRFDAWDSHKIRWNPWSKDGALLAYVRDGQVWISRPDGGATRQLTFDAVPKCKPTFSPDGRRIAYLAKPGAKTTCPQEVWVVDVLTTLGARATPPGNHQINSLDWLDQNTVIFDRVDPTKHFGYGASLWRLSLKE